MNSTARVSAEDPVLLESPASRPSLLDLIAPHGAHLSSLSITLLVLVPFLTAVASYFNVRDLLLVMFLVLALTVYLASFRWTVLDDDFFLMLTASVSLSLLLSATLISGNLHGFDIHQEYSIFLGVSRSGRWNPGTSLLYNSALSISILPYTVTLVSGLDGLYVFQLIFPMIFVIAPLLLYKICRLTLPPAGAFLSVFLFMSYPSSYQEMVTLGRQEIAEVILMLLLWIQLSRRTSRKLPGLVAVLLLTVALVEAHYSMAYLYLVVLFVSFVMSKLSRRVLPLSNMNTLLFTGVVAVLWYLVVAGGVALTTLTQFGRFIIGNLSQDLLNPASRPSVALQALGLASTAPGVLHEANRLAQYLVQFSMILGFVIFARKAQKSPAERGMLPLMVLGFSLLGSAVIVPYFAELGLNLWRLYHISLIFIAPCFVYGTEGLQSGLRSVYSFIHHAPVYIGTHLPSRRLLAATLLFSYLLFTCGWVWAVSMDMPTSLILDRQRMLTYPDPFFRTYYYGDLSVPQDVAGATWLRSRITGNHSVCADFISRYHVLNSYGEFPREGPLLPSECNFSNSYIYSSTLNTVYGIGMRVIGVWAMSDLSPTLTADNKIYTNGGATIYFA